MKQLKVQIISAGILLLLVLLPFVSNAQVPGQISFQGYLTDKMGIPADGDHVIVFSLYTVPTDGDYFWQEPHTVDVADGIYNVILGQPGNLLVPDDFDGDIYLGVKVDPDPDEMTPRQKLTSTAFALKAAISEFAVNADTLDGQDSADFDQSAHVGDINNPHGVTALQAGALEAAIYTAHAGNSSAHHTKTETFNELNGFIDDGQIPDEITRDTELNDGLADKADVKHDHDFRYYTKTEVDAIVESEVNNLQDQINDLKALLLNVTRVDDNITFSGVNVHIVSGSGATNGTHNGLGNLIVGYNEERDDGDDRTGSHNLILGAKQNFSSHGGIVAGLNNTIIGPYASVIGGRNNTANGAYSSVSGGSNNIASGNSAFIGGGGGTTSGYGNTAFADFSAILGGAFNIAGDPDLTDHSIGAKSSVSGGYSNEASGSYSSVIGGRNNTANGAYSSVSGGSNNIASGNSAFIGGGGGTTSGYGNTAFADFSAILGGAFNIAGDPDLKDHTVGIQSSVSGGSNNTASGLRSSVSGGAYNDASGSYSSVSGGVSNTASGTTSSASGGSYSTASGGVSSVSGGIYNDAIGGHSSVSGGYQNTASGLHSSVSGGSRNTASGDDSSVSGGSNNIASGNSAFIGGGGGTTSGYGNTAFADFSAILGGAFNIAGDPDLTDHSIGAKSSVSGGYSNEASGSYSSVSGGRNNTASGDDSSVSGGGANTASGSYSSVSGGYYRSVTGSYDWRAGGSFEDQ